MIETDFARTDLWFMLKGAGMTLALTFWAVLGGTVPLMFTNLPAVLGHIKAGRLRALGITDTTR